MKQSGTNPKSFSALLLHHPLHVIHSLLGSCSWLDFCCFPVLLLEWTLSLASLDLLFLSLDASPSTHPAYRARRRWHSWPSRGRTENANLHSPTVQPPARMSCRTPPQKG
ncbi:hypothetical protein BDW68DRAFT_5181 [Aspergillus falconensis]